MYSARRIHFIGASSPVRDLNSRPLQCVTAWTSRQTKEFAFDDERNPDVTHYAVFEIEMKYTKTIY